MLTITPDAASVLQQQRSSLGAPDDYGIRIAASDGSAPGRSDVSLTFVSGPQPGDEVTEQSGIRAFVAPEVKDRLDNAALDATPTDGTPSELVLRPADSR